MTLILWKAPVVDDPDEAKRLLQPYYDHEDDSAFESSADIAKLSEELLRRFPFADDGPWRIFLRNRATASCSSTYAGERTTPSSKRSVLHWVLMIVGGFFVSVVLFLLGIFIFGRKDN